MIGIVQAAVFASEDPDKGNWFVVPFEDVPECLKGGEDGRAEMGRMISGQMIQVIFDELDGYTLWYRAEPIPDQEVPFAKKPDEKKVIMPRGIKKPKLSLVKPNE